MRVDLIAQTQVDVDRISEAVGGFTRDPDASDGEHLIETAGRLCYLSFERPNPKTASNAAYINHILEVNHGSVLEHATATFLIQGISRSCSHEVVRSRHLSPSQLSQRYVSGAEFVVPPAIKGDRQLEYYFNRAMEEAGDFYDRLLEELDKKYAALPAGTGKKKQARQAARAVLPNATATAMVLTGNYRAWRHFINLRASEAADVEIRALAVECLRQLMKVAPNVFNDFLLADASDGTTIAELDG